MVLDHVTHGASLLVVAAATFHADCFSVRNLHMIDVLMVPQRFEDAVAEAKHQQVLNSFLAEVFIEAEDLVFVKDGRELDVQGLRTRKMVTEWFFYNDPSPTGCCGASHARATKLARKDTEEVRSSGEVEESIVLRVMSLIDFA